MAFREEGTNWTKKSRLSARIPHNRDRALGGLVMCLSEALDNRPLTMTYDHPITYQGCLIRLHSVAVSLGGDGRLENTLRGCGM